MRFILFDLYETLISYGQAPVRKARAEMARRAGVPFAALHGAAERTMRDRMLGAWGPSLDDELAAILREAGARPTGELVARFRASELGAWRDATIEYDDVVPGLRQLRAAGWRIALVSNCSHMTRPLLFDQWDLGALFDAVVLSCELGRLKPQLAIWKKAIEQLGGCGSGVVVDDQEAYLDAACGLGLTGFRMDRRTGRPPGAHRGVRDVTELCELLGSGVGRAAIHRRS